MEVHRSALGLSQPNPYRAHVPAHVLAQKGTFVLLYLCHLIIDLCHLIIDL